MSSEQSIYEFGTFRIDTAERVLLRDGKPVSLTPKAFEVLMLLLENRGRIVEKDELINQVWPDSFVEEGNLKVTVSMLRKVLEGGVGEQQFIETVPRRGYRFVAEVRELSNHVQDLIVLERTRSEVLIEEEEGPPSQECSSYDHLLRVQPPGQDAGAEYLLGKTRRHNTILALALVASVVVIAATTYYYYSARSTRAEIRSIAVLPFANSSDSPDAEYLSDGITESLINSLSKLENLRVTARTTAFAFKGRSSDPLQAGRELNVDALLTGRVTQRGDTLGIQVDLINVADGSQLWGERYHRKLSDILAVQGEIAREISEKMRLRLTGEDEQRLTKRYTENVEAYRLYLQGRYFWNKVTEEGLGKSFGYFKQAIEKDPKYALAYAGLADSYILAGFFSMHSPAESYGKAKEASTRALEIDNKLGEAHATLALVLIWYEWNWPAGEAEFKRAIELSPTYALAHQGYGRALTMIGRFDEGLTALKRAQELEPLSLIIDEEIGTAFLFARRYEEAIRQVRATLDKDPRFAFAYINLSIGLVQTGKTQEAIAELEKALSLENENVFVLSLMGFAHARNGGKEKAGEIIKRLKELGGRKYVSPQHIARIYAALGERDQAFEWIEKSYERRDYNLPYLRVDPTFESLRPDPRFAGMVRRVGLPE